MGDATDGGDNGDTGGYGGGFTDPGQAQAAADTAAAAGFSGGYDPTGGIGNADAFSAQGMQAAGAYGGFADAPYGDVAQTTAFGSPDALEASGVMGTIGVSGYDAFSPEGMAVVGFDPFGNDPALSAYMGADLPTDPSTAPVLEASAMDLFNLLAGAAVAYGVTYEGLANLFGWPTIGSVVAPGFNAPTMQNFYGVPLPGTPGSPIGTDPNDPNA